MFNKLAIAFDAVIEAYLAAFKKVETSQENLRTGVDEGELISEGRNARSDAPGV